MLSTSTGRFQTSYAADAAIQRVPLARIAFWGSLAVTFLVAPRVLSDYWLTSLNFVWTAVIAAVGLNILVGYTGQISLGHGAFAMVGAFTVAMLYDRWPALRGMPFELFVTIPVAGMISAMVGAIFGIPSLRVRGLYLAIATLAAHPVLEWFVQHVLHKWTVSGKPFSSLPVPRPEFDIVVWSHTIRTDTDRFYLFGALAVFGIVFAENLFRTRIGRAWIAIRDREIAAESVGIDLYKYKLMAFAISAFYAGVAGALLAYWYRSVSHEAFPVTLSVEYLAMIIIGGLGSVPGSLMGAAFIAMTPVVLRDQIIPRVQDVVPRLAKFETFVRQMIFGLLIVVFVIWEPNGLYRLWIRLKSAVARWPFAV
ncbi:MAG: branched-chain amino acid ABC transporter permease [Chloroflexota bacterium]